MLETVHTNKTKQSASRINHLLTISTTTVYNPIYFNSTKVSKFILHWSKPKSEVKKKIHKMAIILHRTAQ